MKLELSKVVEPRFVGVSRNCDKSNLNTFTPKQRERLKPFTIERHPKFSYHTTPEPPGQIFGQLNRFKRDSLQPVSVLDYFAEKSVRNIDFERNNNKFLENFQLPQPKKKITQQETVCLEELKVDAQDVSEVKQQLKRMAQNRKRDIKLPPIIRNDEPMSPKK